MRRFWSVFDNFHSWLRPFWHTIALAMVWRLYESGVDPWPYLLQAQTDDDLTLAALWRQESKSLSKVVLRLLLNQSILFRLISIDNIFRKYRTMSADFYKVANTVSGVINHALYCMFDFNTMYVGTLMDAICNPTVLFSTGCKSGDSCIFCFNDFERRRAPANSHLLIGHMSLLLSALSWYCHYSIYPSSFPWALVGILSDNESRRTETMTRIKSLFNLVILLETNLFDDRSWIINICSIFKWQMFREILEVAAEHDFKVSDHLLTIAKQFFQLGGTLCLETSFNDLRDVERRGRKMVTCTTNDLHITQVRSVCNRMQGREQIHLEDSDLIDTGFMEGHHVDNAVFNSCKMADKATGIDLSPLSGPTSWASTTPERFSNVQLCLITALLILSDLSLADKLWMAGLLCRGMIVQKGAGCTHDNICNSLFD